jgi:hypothetical protein
MQIGDSLAFDIGQGCPLEPLGRRRGAFEDGAAYKRISQRVLSDLRRGSWVPYGTAGKWCPRVSAEAHGCRQLGKGPRL